MAKYSSKWVERFVDGKSRVINILGSQISKVHHVGSTSIKGLCAKPIIDMIIEVQDFKKNDVWIQLLQDYGYRYIDKWNDVMPFRRLFARYENDDFDNKVLEHLHIVGKGHKFVGRHLLFRDFLRHSKTDRDAYCDLKKTIIEGGILRKDYNEAKTEFIKSIDAKAYYWKYGKELPADYYDEL